MLTRLYVNNYKTLLNFEFKPPRLSVLVGENGSGKSNVGNVLFGLFNLIIGRSSAAEAFPTETLCRWLNDSRQVFELEHRIAAGHFKYRLEILHDRDRRVATILDEVLIVDGQRAYLFRNGTVQLGEQTDAPPIAFQSTHSFLPQLAGGATAGVTRFKELVASMLALKPTPPRMESLSDAEHNGLMPGGENLASFFRWFVQTKPQLIGPYFSSLAAVLPGFQAAALEKVGPRAMELMVSFREAERSYTLSLRELSDGQRQLMLLYLLLHGFEEGEVLFLDEPDNFLSLREIQPWLSELERVLEVAKAQAMVISHSTEAMDYLASRQAFIFSRGPDGSTQVHPHDDSDGTKPSEVILYGSNQA